MDDCTIGSLGDVAPEERLRNRGLRATSEAAQSSASTMSVLMAQMGKEHKKLERGRTAERHWLEQENSLLKDALG